MQILPTGFTLSPALRPQDAAAAEAPVQETPEQRPARLPTVAELKQWAVCEPERAQSELLGLLEGRVDGLERLRAVLTAARGDEPLKRLIEPHRQQIWGTGNMAFNLKLLEEKHLPDAGFAQRELWPRVAESSEATRALQALWELAGPYDRNQRLAPLLTLERPVGQDMGALLQEQFSDGRRPGPELRAHLQDRVEQSLTRLAEQPLGRALPDPELEAHRQQLQALTPFVEDKQLARRLLERVMADPSLPLYSEAGKAWGLAAEVYQRLFPDPDTSQALLSELGSELKSAGSLAGLSERGQRVFGVLVAQAEDRSVMGQLGAVLEDEFRRPHSDPEQAELLTRLLVLNASACSSALQGNWRMQESFPRLRHMVELLVESKWAHADRQWHHLENGWAGGLTEQLEKHLWHGIYGKTPVPTVAPVQDGAMSLSLKESRQHVAEMLDQFASGPENPKAGAAIQILEHLARRDQVLADHLLADSKTLLRDWNAVPVEGVRYAVSRLRNSLLERNLKLPAAEREARREETLQIAASMGREGVPLVTALQTYYPAVTPVAARLLDPQAVLALYQEVQSHVPESSVNQRFEWVDRLLTLVQAQGSEHVLEDTLKGYRRLEELLASGQNLTQALDVVALEIYDLNGLLGGQPGAERAPTMILEDSISTTFGGSRLKKRRVSD